MQFNPPGAPECFLALLAVYVTVSKGKIYDSPAFVMRFLTQVMANGDFQTPQNYASQIPCPNSSVFSFKEGFYKDIDSISTFSLKSIF